VAVGYRLGLAVGGKALGRHPALADLGGMGRLEQLKDGAHAARSSHGEAKINMDEHPLLHCDRAPCGTAAKHDPRTGTP
jgi:hypothetical protein